MTVYYCFACLKPFYESGLDPLVRDELIAGLQSARQELLSWFPRMTWRKRSFASHVGISRCRAHAILGRYRIARWAVPRD